MESEMGTVAVVKETTVRTVRRTMMSIPLEKPLESDDLEKQEERVRQQKRQNERVQQFEVLAQQPRRLLENGPRVPFFHVWTSLAHLAATPEPHAIHKHNPIELSMHFPVRTPQL